MKKEKEKKQMDNIIKNNKLNIKEKLKNLSKLKNINSTPDIFNLNNLSNKNQMYNPKKIKLKINASSTTNNFNHLNNKIFDTKNNFKFSFYSPKTFPKFHKINPISPMNYFQKYNFLSKKNKSLQNLRIKNNNTSRILKNNNTSFYNINNNNSISKTKYISSLENNKSLTKILKKNFSDYFYKSQDDLYSSKRIFRHYIHESNKDKITPENFFFFNGAPKHKKELDDLYKLNINYHTRLEEIKSNKSIAYKKDFNIMNYQATLLKLVSKKMSQKNVKDVQKRYITFNEKNFGIGHAPRGRFTNLAEKIKYNVPLFLYERIRQLDKEKLISRYNYFKRASENMHNKFEKMYYKKHKKLFKKKEEKDNSWNKSYNKYKENVYTIKNMTSKSQNKKLKLNIKYNNYNNSF